MLSHGFQVLLSVVHRPVPAVAVDGSARVSAVAESRVPRVHELSHRALERLHPKHCQARAQRCAGRDAGSGAVCPSVRLPFHQSAVAGGRSGTGPSSWLQLAPGRIACFCSAPSPREAERRGAADARRPPPWRMGSGAVLSGCGGRRAAEGSTPRRHGAASEGGVTAVIPSTGWSSALLMLSGCWIAKGSSLNLAICS